MKVPKWKASNTSDCETVGAFEPVESCGAQVVKNTSHPRMRTLKPFLREQTATTGNGNKRPDPANPLCLDTVCCFWRSGSGCRVAAETAVFLWGKLSFQPLWLYTLRASTLARFQLWPVCPQQHDTFRTNLGSNLRPSPGLCFSLIFWLWAVQPYAPPVLVFGISCSTHNVNQDWTGLHYFWR